MEAFRGHGGMAGARRRAGLSRVSTAWGQEDGVAEVSAARSGGAPVPVGSRSRSGFAAVSRPLSP